MNELLEAVLQANKMAAKDYHAYDPFAPETRRIIVHGCADGLIKGPNVFGNVARQWDADVSRNPGATLSDSTINDFLFLAKHHPIELVIVLTHTKWCGAEHYARTDEGAGSTIAQLIRARVQRFEQLKREMQVLYERELKAKGRKPIEVVWFDLEPTGILVPVM